MLWFVGGGGCMVCGWSVVVVCLFLWLCCVVLWVFCVRIGCVFFAVLVAVLGCSLCVGVLWLCGLVWWFFFSVGGCCDGLVDVCEC